MTPISKRALQVLKNKMDGSYIFEDLESTSKISAKDWKNFYEEKQNATLEMVSFIVCEWPYYMSWVMSGCVPREPIPQYEP